MDIDIESVELVERFRVPADRHESFLTALLDTAKRFGATWLGGDTIEPVRG